MLHCNGEGGIRTHEPPFGSYAISNRVLSATQTPLHSNGKHRLLCNVECVMCHGGPKNSYSVLGSCVSLHITHRRLHKRDVVSYDGGEGGIRTHEGLAALPLFESGAFNRAQPPLLVHVDV